MRRAAGETFVRFLLFCAALGLLRWANVTRTTWEQELGSSFELELAPWGRWVALLVGAGVVFGLACVSGRPAGYRVRVPLVTTVPALLLLGHFALLYSSLGPDGTDLPWILGDVFFYMDIPPQFVLATVAGFGLAAGLRTKTAVAVSSTGGTESPSAG